MKRGLRSALTAMTLGLVALGMSARPASAQIDPLNNPMVAGSPWQGFSWDPANAPTGGASLALWTAQNTSFTGGVSFMGRGRIVAGRFNFADGSVDITESNSSAPLMFKGAIVPTRQGGYVATLKVTQLTRSLGTIKLLWLRKKATPDGLFPPGPCLGPNTSYNGQFVGDSGDTHGLIALLFNPQRPAGDNAQSTSFETGDMVLQDLHFKFVATIDPDDGVWRFDLLGQSTSPTLPAVQMGGTYLINTRTGAPSGFQGSYQPFNSMFSPFAGGIFSAFAP